MLLRQANSNTYLKLLIQAKRKPYNLRTRSDYFFIPYITQADPINPPTIEAEAIKTAIFCQMPKPPA